MTNFPANASCSSSSSAPIGSCDHVLVKVNISLTIPRKQPQRWRVWQFTQASWQGPQAIITLQDWSPISTTSDINSAWEIFHRSQLSLMHRFIPSHLQLSYPSTESWYTKFCVEAVALEQLAFSSWRQKPKKTSDHSTKPASVCPLRRAREQHLSNVKIELSNSSSTSKTW